MLKTLSLHNFILIEKLTVNFASNFVVLTGETGTGKSIMAGALKKIFGESAGCDSLYKKGKSAYLEASFSIDKSNVDLQTLISRHALEIEGDEIFFAKEISPAGRGKSFINGRRVSAGIIKEFSAPLLDFNSQHDQILLFNNSFQLHLLDEFGNCGVALQVFQKHFHKLKIYQSELLELQEKEKESREKLELYAYQIDEINEIDPQLGEDDVLEKEMYLMQNQEEILEVCNDFEYTLRDADASIIHAVRKYASEFDNFADSSASMATVASHLHEALSWLEDALSESCSVANSMDVDDEKAEIAEDRYNRINEIKMKYRRNLAEIIAYKTEIETYIRNASTFTKRINELHDLLSQIKKDTCAAALSLSTRRKKAALKLSTLIEKNLALLAIPHATFKIKFDKKIIQADNVLIEDLSDEGIDKISFYFSANASKDAQLLKNAVSGGELSRLLLTIKKILAEKINSQTIIFDEIDAGIGGITAEHVGEFIKDISAHHQIVCITHLPQIAVHGVEHYAINKIDNIIDITCLNEDARRQEIARMLAGTISELSLKHAEELLKRR